MYDYGRPRPLHIEKSLEAARLVTRAGKVAIRRLVDRSILIEEDYFCMERIPIAGSLLSAGLQSADETAPGLAYLFAAAGAGRIVSPQKTFAPVDLPARAIAAIPAASPEFVVEDAGGLELIRITPRWPVVKP
jgi:mannose-6-phosphate isomerase